jgi:hypothetical protein
MNTLNLALWRLVWWLRSVRDRFNRPRLPQATAPTPRTHSLPGTCAFCNTEGRRYWRSGPGGCRALGCAECDEQQDPNQAIGVKRPSRALFGTPSMCGRCGARGRCYWEHIQRGTWAHGCEACDEKQAGEIIAR